MFRPRVIPVLLLQGNGLVKSVQFKNHNYIGDPINAVKIFNEFKADELVFLDILASKEDRLISLDFVRDVGEEANMPFAVGGGIKTVKDIQDVIASGAEKVIISSAAIRNPNFIKEASVTFGSSTIVVCIDVKKKFLGEERVWSQNGSKVSKYKPEEFAELMQKNGAGEIIIQSITNDGEMNGFNISLIKKISNQVKIPVVALGGAGNINDLKEVYNDGYANGLAAGSLFVYQNKMRGVLINYPEKKVLKKIYL